MLTTERPDKPRSMTDFCKKKKKKGNLNVLFDLNKAEVFLQKQC